MAPRQQHEGNAPGSPGAPAYRWRLYSEDELNAMPGVEYLAEGIIPKRSLITLTGQAGLGKTFVALDIARALNQTDVKLAGQFPVLEPCNVVYAAGEKSNGIGARLRACGIQQSGGEFQTRAMLDVPQLAEEEPDFDEFIEALKAVPSGVGLLIIDTLNSAMVGAEENGSIDMGKAVKTCKEIIRLVGCSVLLVAHPSKSGTKDPRGHSSLGGAAEVMLSLSRVGSSKKHLTLECEKNSEATEFDPIGLTLLEHEGSLKVCWEGTTERRKPSEEDLITVVETLRANEGTAMTLKEIADLTGISRSVVDRLRPKLLKDPAISDATDYGKKVSKTNPRKLIILPSEHSLLTESGNG